MPGFCNLSLRGGLLSIALILASAVLFYGCQASKSASGRAPVAASGPPPAKSVPPVEANIFVDEAMLSKPYAIIGGTVQNVGSEKLEALTVEIELRRRETGDTEKRVVAVQPSNLSPGEKGRYSLKVLSDEWGGSRLVGLYSSARPEAIAFKPLPGSKRPPERNDARVVVVKTQPRKKSDGDGFINTPDTPFKVP
jgi:hypothetical protein